MFACAPRSVACFAFLCTLLLVTYVPFVVQYTLYEPPAKRHCTVETINMTNDILYAIRFEIYEWNVFCVYFVCDLRGLCAYAKIIQNIPVMCDCA